MTYYIGESRAKSRDVLSLTSVTDRRIGCLGRFFFLPLVSLAFSQLTQKHPVILCTLGANNDLLAAAGIVQGYTADDGFFTA
jgi:hypothetical protein